MPLPTKPKAARDRPLVSDLMRNALALRKQRKRGQSGKTKLKLLLLSFPLQLRLQLQIRVWWRKSETFALLVLSKPQIHSPWAPETWSASSLRNSDSPVSSLFFSNLLLFFLSWMFFRVWFLNFLGFLISDLRSRAEETDLVFASVVE